MRDPDILLALKDVLDPELGISIVDLGLVYRAAWTPDGIAVDMTTTSPACPFRERLAGQARDALRQRFVEARSVRVRLLSEPRWSHALVSDEGRWALGWGPASPPPGLKH